MAIAFQTKAEGGFGAATLTTLPVDKPSGPAVGDHVLVWMSTSGGAASLTFTPPDTGWELAANNFGTTNPPNIVCFSKIMTAGDIGAGTWDFTTNAAVTGSFASERRTGVDPNDPIGPVDATGGNDTEVSTFVSATVTPLTDNAVVVFGYGTRRGTGVPAPITHDASLTSRSYSSNSTTIHRSLGTADLTQTTAAATGSKTATPTDAVAASYRAASVVLRAAVPNPSPRSSASATSSGTGTSVTINKQTSTATGDRMEATVAFFGGTGVTITATGWSLEDRRDSTTVIGIATYSKVAGASESVETWTLSGSQQWVSACESYYLASGSTPTLDVSNGQANASSLNIAAPQVTTAVVDELLRFSGAVAAGQAGGITAPTGMSELADVQTGTGAGGTAAAKTLYLMGGTLVNSYQPMQDGGTAPTDAFFATGTGWLSAANANGTMSELRPNVIRARTLYATTPVVPTAITTGASANAFRSPTAYNGSFASGNWTLSASMRSSVAQPSTTRLRWRVFASTDATGATGVRELTTAVQLTNAIATTTTANATMTVTWAAPAITLVNEYLFFAVANEMVALSGTGNTRDTQFRQNSASAITTTTFTPTLNLALEVAQQSLAAAGATGTRTAVSATNAAVSVASLIALRAPVTASLILSTNDVLTQLRRR